MTRILAAALCCLLLAGCGSLSDRLAERQRDRQYDTLQDALTHTERHK
jgi:outer membrane biogenesis lipoprotein LolB